MSKEAFTIQEKCYSRLCKELGKEKALFCLCAVFNKPFRKGVNVDSWSAYVDILGDTKDKFHHGDVDTSVISTSSNNQMDDWKNIWGIGCEENPYSIDDYKRMDKLFETYSERLNASGGMDAQQEDTIRSCVKMRLLADKSLASGTKDGVAMNTQLNKTIQQNLSAENLRKKDAKPLENAKIDGIVDALTKKYGASVFLSYNEAVDICCKWIQEHHYPMTMDAAEHVILAITNCMRTNNDMPELDELPQNMRFDPSHATEFEAVPNEMEKEAYEYLNIKNMSSKPYYSGE